ncbi:MAG: type I methionyl aminopeptidase [Microthrixaceae bacterium]
MRVSGRLAAEVLNEVCGAVEVGITTDELDRIGHEAAVARDCYPSPLNYRGFPKSLCTSINEVICHGIPDSRRLADGDIINIDVTVFHDGVHGDTSCTVLVGDVDEDSRRLVRVTRSAMHAGINAVRPGGRVNDIGKAIEAEIDRHGGRFGIVREFIGHGIGDQFHTSLQIPHYFDPRATTEFKPGMTFTIEPMITIGPAEVWMWDDEWTALTVSGQRTAQFEHTMVVTDSGVELLTVPADGPPAEERFAESEATATA